MTYTIQLNNIEELYFRKYYKVQDLAPQVGGIFKLLMGSFIFLSKWYSEQSFYESIINSFFNIKFSEGSSSFLPNNNDDIASQDKKSIRSKTKIDIENPFKDTNLKQTQLSQISQITQNDMNTQINSLPTIKPKTKIQFDLSFFDKLIMLKALPKCSKAKKMNQWNMFNHKMTFVNKYLDIANMVGFYYHIDVLDHVMFSNNQMNLMHKLFKPVLTQEKCDSTTDLKSIASSVLKKLIPFHSPNLGMEIERNMIRTKSSFYYNDNEDNQPMTIVEN